MSERKHSRAYHRYFENYAEREVIDPNGRRKIQRVYVGQYYAVDLPAPALAKQRICLGFLFLICAAGYLAGALNAQVSAVPLAALATMPPLIALPLLGIAMFYRLTAPKEMEVRTWRDSSENLRRYSLVFFICMLVCAAVSFAVSLAVPGYPLRETLPVLLCYTAAGAAGWCIWRIERATQYRVLSPKWERPAESAPVRYEMPD